MKYLKEYKLFESSEMDEINNIKDILQPCKDVGNNVYIDDIGRQAFTKYSITIHPDPKRLKHVNKYKVVEDSVNHLIKYMDTCEFELTRIHIQVNNHRIVSESLPDSNDDFYGIVIGFKRK